MMDALMAWRNIWRNPRRTAVILIAVVIGVWSMVFLGALMRGIVKGMIDNGIKTLTGHIQLHPSGYIQNPSVDHHIATAGETLTTIKQLLPVQSFLSGRVRVNAVANNARHNGGVTLVGINPEDEARVSFIGTSINEGRYLKPDDTDAIVIGRALAERFETKLGRKLILMAQDTSGEIASYAFRIRGIFQTEMEATEKGFVFVPLTTAQQTLGLKNAISEIAIMLPGYDQVETVARMLEDRFNDGDIEVRTWREALPLLVSYLDLYNSFILIWFVVVFIAMGFGIVNTTLMAVFERMREFGLLKALGMRPRRIVGGILIESFLILICGIALGNIAGLVSCWALSFKGIDLSSLAQGVEYAGMSRIIYPVLQTGDLISANAVVLGLGLLVSCYPAIKAARFTPVAAMRQN
jgi:ABC-type lipoprotein release transport system permease subunit